MEGELSQQLVLASASPRREELLRQIGCKFQIRVSDVEEDNSLKLPPAQLVTAHAKAKATTVAAKCSPDEIVIGADTIVVLAGEVYGKPKDRDDARRMLSQLAGKEHQVITGIAVAAHRQSWTNYCETLVRIRQLSVIEMEAYLATGEPDDKAGAYAIQGVGSLLVSGITGSYTNVVGLPLVELDALLRQSVGYGLL
jgi:septum formation protein